MRRQGRWWGTSCPSKRFVTNKDCGTGEELPFVTIRQVSICECRNFCLDSFNARDFLLQARTDSSVSIYCTDVGESWYDARHVAPTYSHSPDLSHFCLRSYNAGAVAFSKGDVNYFYSTRAILFFAPFVMIEGCADTSSFLPSCCLVMIDLTHCRLTKILLYWSISFIPHEVAS
jgi:hypothetical protein